MTGTVDAVVPPKKQQQSYGLLPPMNKFMNIVNIKRAADRLGVSYSFAAALKKCAGINSRLFEFERLRDWWRANPDFRMMDAYPATRLRLRVRAACLPSKNAAHNLHKTETAGVKHLGPTAQVFHPTSGLNGSDDTHIATVDEGGATMQGLPQTVHEQDDRLKEWENELQCLKHQNQVLEERLQQLERR